MLNRFRRGRPTTAATQGDVDPRNESNLGDSALSAVTFESEAGGGIGRGQGRTGKGRQKRGATRAATTTGGNKTGNTNYGDLDNDDNNNNNQTAALLNPPRLVVRDLPFDQSRNHVRVDHNQGFRIYFLVLHDWFHALLRRSTCESLFVLLSVWTLFIIIFAGLYMAVDREYPDVSCGLTLEGDPPLGFYGSFAFSLETCTTVGYTLPYSVNSFFENCPALQIVIYFQSIWSILFNAMMISLFYSRVAKAESRSVQVVFSNKAIVSLTADQVRFQVRVVDVDASHPVVEAHVRVYAVRKDRPVPRPLRLIQPNDELNGMLFLSMPTVVAHHIDVYSMLHPPVPTPVNACGLPLRQVDSSTASREGIICPICGESYGTHERWVNHVRFNKISEKVSNFPVSGTHLSIKEEDLLKSKWAPTTDLEKLRDYFQNHISEVIVVVEGIDPLMSGTFCALQSYQFDDIIWGNAASFHPCVAVDEEMDIMRLDLDRFHDIDTPEVRVSRVRQTSIRTHDSFMEALSEAGESNPANNNNNNEDKSHKKVPSTIPRFDAIVEEGEEAESMRDIARNKQHSEDSLFGTSRDNAAVLLATTVQSQQQQNQTSSMPAAPTGTMAFSATTDHSHSLVSGSFSPDAEDRA